MDYVLVHYGIKGQQHGVRRWQNEDGSLTPAGRERYSKYSYKLLDATANATAVSGGVAKNEVKRQADLTGAEVAYKLSGKTTMAKAKLMAAKGKYALSLAKDGLKLGMAAARVGFNMGRLALVTDKLLKGSGNQAKTTKDMESAMKSAAAKYTKDNTVGKLTGALKRLKG